MVLAGFVSQPAAAANLFEIIARSTDHENDPNLDPLEVRAAGSSVIDLIENLLEKDDAFAQFQEPVIRAFRAELTFLGVENAMVFTMNAEETEATLEFPITGFSRTFGGLDRDDLEDQIIDFLKEDGADVYAKFQREIEKRSLVAVLDGNPGSTTALLSRQSFHRYGLGQVGPTWFERPAAEWPEGDRRRWWFSLNPFGELIDADRFSGEAVGLDVSIGVWFTEWIGLSLSSVYAYRDIEGAASFHGGTDLALPIRLRPRRPLGNTGMQLGWQITPFGTFGGGGSLDMASGGLIGGGGVTNQLRFGFPHFDLVAASQIAHYQGLRLAVDDYSFEPELSQQVLTNGVLAHYPIGQREEFVLEGGATYTRYLRDAAVQDWVSPTIGATYRTNGNSTFKLNYTATLGENSYTSHALQLGANFQF